MFLVNRSLSALVICFAILSLGESAAWSVDPYWSRASSPIVLTSTEPAQDHSTEGYVVAQRNSDISAERRRVESRLPEFDQRWGIPGRGYAKAGFDYEGCSNQCRMNPSSGCRQSCQRQLDEARWRLQCEFNIFVRSFSENNPFCRANESTLHVSP